MDTINNMFIAFNISLYLPFHHFKVVFNAIIDLQGFRVPMTCLQVAAHLCKRGNFTESNLAKFLKKCYFTYSQVLIVALVV